MAVEEGEFTDAAGFLTMPEELPDTDDEAVDVNFDLDSSIKSDSQGIL